MAGNSRRFSAIHVTFICCSIFAALNIYKGTISSEYFSDEDIVDKVATSTPDHTITKPSAQEDKHSLAYSQSYGFFDDITDDDWKLRQRRAAEHINHKNPDNVLISKNSESWYVDNYEPNFSCPLEMRIGGDGNGDGPKWVCDPHRFKKMAARRKAMDPNHPGCVVYSIGSCGDFSFELGMQKEVGEDICEYHIFDMGDYGPQVPKELKRAHYHQWGLKEQDPKVDKPAPGQTFYGLLDTIKLLGHENLDTIDIFKIDCEGCEWDTFQDWIGEGIPTLLQIQVELHNALKAGQKVVDFFDSFEKEGYLRFHKEPNLLWTKGIEYAFLKLEKDFLQEKFNK